jgi:glucuronokinase
LSVEKEELGISAGLQDRVIQTYGGLVHMNFHPDRLLEERYQSLDPTLLPQMYLLYNTHAGK